MPGDLDIGFDDPATKRNNEYVEIDGWQEAKCKRECIMHHCRTCQYDWETGTLGANT